MAFAINNLSPNLWP